MTDPDGMFTDLRLLEDGTSVVTCTRCGATVHDTDAHGCYLDQGSGHHPRPSPARREDKFTSTPDDAAHYEARRGQADG